MAEVDVLICIGLKSHVDLVTGLCKDRKSRQKFQ
jgi:hypothetical protein